MRIAFTGASSTGKTSLAYGLQEKEPSLAYINVDARKIIDSLNHSNIDNLNNEEFIIFQKEWLNQKIINESKKTNFITDRTYVDAIAYMSNRNIEDKILFDLYLQNMKVYDYIFYLPIGRIPFQKDGYRSMDEKGNTNVDNIILKLLDINNIKYNRIDISDFNKSLEYILNIIGGGNV